MKIFAHEIDSDTPTNISYIERWQEKFGSIYRKLGKLKCINCKTLKDQDEIQYVACHNGKLLMWHTKCPNSKKTNQ